MAFDKPDSLGRGAVFHIQIGSRALFNGADAALHGKGLAGAGKGKLDDDRITYPEAAGNIGGDATFAGAFPVAGNQPGDGVNYGCDFQMSFRILTGRYLTFKNTWRHGLSFALKYKEAKLRR